MKIYYSAIDFPSNLKSVITIGTFDGFHKGHKSILEKARRISIEKKLELVLLTFSPHPRHVLFPENQDLQLLDTVDEKIIKMREAGVQHLVIHKFTKEFSRTKSIQFVRDILVNKFNMKHMVVGYDHHFGKNREGSFSELREFAELYNFGLDRVSAHMDKQITISSTKIRKLLNIGDVDQARRLLGCTYNLFGIIIHGDKLGRTIDFPTANIKVDKNKLIPKPGVYAVKVVIEDCVYFGMLNISVNADKIEVYIFDFSREIYGKKIQIQFVSRLRDEKRFESLSLLKIQLQKDEVVCRKKFKI